MSLLQQLLAHQTCWCQQAHPEASEVAAGSAAAPEGEHGEAGGDKGSLAGKKGPKPRKSLAGARLKPSFTDLATVSGVLGAFNSPAAHHPAAACLPTLLMLSGIARHGIKYRELLQMFP